MRKKKSTPSEFLSSVLSTIVLLRFKTWKFTTFCQKNWKRSTMTLLSITMSRDTWKIPVGALVLAATLCSLLIRIFEVTNVQLAGNITAWTVKVSFMKKWLASNSGRSPIWTKTINSSCYLPRGPNINNVQDANFGSKEVRVAIIWPADVDTSSAISAEESMEDVSAEVTIIKRQFWEGLQCLES